MDAGHGRVRLGIIGTGFISAVHARCALRSPAVELVAIASARGRARRDRVGPLAPAVRLLTVEELVASADVEAVVVCSRTRDHADHAVAVLAGGKHLLLEKPGAITLADHARIEAAAATRPHQIVRVAYHRRHDAGFREVARLVGEGAVGEPFAVHQTSREDYPPSADDGPAGGFVMDVGVHDFDAARWLLGRDPDTVYALAQNPVYADAELDNVHITVGHAGAVATTHLSRTSRIGMEIRCEVVGADGSVLLTHGARGAGVTVHSAASPPGFPDDCRGRFGAAYQAQMDDFGAACRGGETRAATLTDDRWAVAVAVAARAGALRRERLEVGPDWEWPAAG